MLGIVLVAFSDSRMVSDDFRCFEQRIGGQHLELRRVGHEDHRRPVTNTCARQADRHTSSDSVFQSAAHETSFPRRAIRIHNIAFELASAGGLGRVIADRSLTARWLPRTAIGGTSRCPDCGNVREIV